MKNNLDTALLERVALHVPDILLPNLSIDLKKWAVVACDQFTSEPEYWHEVEKISADLPSTYHIIFPEVYLENPDKTQRIKHINQTMQNYLDQGVFSDPLHGFILVQRTMKNGILRNGLMVALDLEKYDFHAGCHAMIRATEQTVMDRIPPRVQIREFAPIELPHVLVLMDDPYFTVIEPLLASHKKDEQIVYDTDLMMEGGHIKGYRVDGIECIHQIASALANLIKPDGYLYAVGDGNHSLATAKQCWDNLKTTLNKEELLNHPARYALVELNNVHDEGLLFEPIHRLIFQAETEDLINFLTGDGEEVQVVQGPTNRTIRLKERPGQLTVGVLQTLLDEYIHLHSEIKIDYIHGENSLRKLSNAKDRLGFLLPVLCKSDLFKTVAIDGTLPRKTFSMGEAEEKRYYCESRKIR